MQKANYDESVFISLTRFSWLIYIYIYIYINKNMKVVVAVVVFVYFFSTTL